MKQILLPAVTTLFLAACAEGPTELATAGGPSFDAVGVVHAASGSGSTFSFYRTFAFNAQQIDDRGVNGRFNLVRRDGPLQMGGKVVCLSVDGSRALVGGVIDTSNDAGLVGHEATFLVEDNGTGSPSPDRMSPLVVDTGDDPGWAQSECDQPTFPYENTWLPVDAGNISVR